MPKSSSMVNVQASLVLPIVAYEEMNVNEGCGKTFLYVTVCM